MRALIVVVGLAVLGAAAYWWLQRDLDAQAPPPGPAAPAVTTAADDRPDDPAAARAAATSDRPDPPAPTPATGEPPAARAEAPTAPPPDRPTIVEARDAGTNQLLQAFRWRFDHGEERLRGESDEGVGALLLPEGATGDLLIEADGMQPASEKALYVPRLGEEQLRLQVYLTPTATALGITLLVHDVDRRPIANVRVDAFELDEQTRDGAWHLGKPMWARRAAAADGRYQLPPLPPGEYGVRVLATDAQGALLPTGPFRRAYTLNGTNGFLEDVTLEPACALRLELVEPNGETFDPEVHGNVTISLHAPGERDIQRKWTAARRDGVGTVSEADHVPAPAPVWLAEPVAPGSYTLEVFVNGDPRVLQTLQLRPEAQTERVFVR